MNVVVSASGQLAPLASIVVFLAPLPTIRTIAKERTVGSLPLLPYSSMIASAFLWTSYGVLKSAPEIWSSNLVGLILGLYYTTSFVRHAPPHAQSLPGTVRQHVQGVASVVAGTLLVAATQHGASAANWIGKAGIVFCLVMFAAPLAALSTVLATQSARSIPWPFTLASTANCVLWVVWGVWGRQDANLYVPNGLGLLFGLAQIALKLRYGDGKGLYTQTSSLEPTLPK